MEDLLLQAEAAINGDPTPGAHLIDMLGKAPVGAATRVVHKLMGYEV